MKAKLETILAAAVLSAVTLQQAAAHMEPHAGDHMEKCYGVAKAHHNDCASKAAHHSCAGQAKTDKAPDEWVKMPTGLCEKITGGSLKPAQQDEQAGNK